MVQRRQGVLKPLSKSTQKEKEKKEMGPLNTMNSRNTKFIAGGPSLSSSPSQATSEIEAKKPMTPSL